MGRREWVEAKTKALADIKARADKLSSEEEDIKRELKKYVRKANHKKKILLTTELLERMHYPDTGVAFRCYTGFPLVGEMSKVPVFEQRPEEQVLVGADEVWLGRIAREARKTLVAKVAATPADDILRQLWKITTDEKEGEVAMGWAEGPYDEQQINDIFGDDLWIAARRFGVAQGFKNR